MTRIVAAWKCFSDGLERFCLIFSSLALILVSVGVMLVPLLRPLGISLDFLQEMPQEFAGYIAFPLLGVLLKTGRHVSVDLLETQLKGKPQKILMLVIHLASMVGAYMLLKASSIALSYYLGTGQAFDTEVPVPTWIIEMALVIGSAILLLFAAELAIQGLASLAGYSSPTIMERRK